MRVFLKVLKVLGLLFMGLIVVMAGVYLYADNAPYLREGYNKHIETGGAIETTYLQNGPYPIKRTTARAEAPIKKYTIYYPEEMMSGDNVFPLILLINGTGGKASKYEPEFAQLASWGFIVIGNQDKNTGTGETAIRTLNYMLEQNEDPGSLFFHRIDKNNIGISGFSQGGAAVFNAVTRYQESLLFKTAVPLSPVSENGTARMTSYPYDITKVQCPVLMLAGTEGDFELFLFGQNQGVFIAYGQITSLYLANTKLLFIFVAK